MGITVGRIESCTLTGTKVLLVWIRKYFETCRFL